MNSCGVEIDFASATQGHSLGRGDHGPRRVFDGHIYALKLAHREVYVVPLALLRGHQQQHQVRASGKIRGLIPDYHGFEFGFQSRDARVQHRDEISADRVHLRVELAAEHSVAQVNQACAGILLHHRRAVLERLQN